MSSDSPGTGKTPPPAPSPACSLCAAGSPTKTIAGWTFHIGPSDVLMACKNPQRPEVLHLHAQPSPLPSKTGAQLIRDERARQVLLGYDKLHDSQHGSAKPLCRAALSYLTCEGPEAAPANLWPWSTDAWKPKDRLRNLVRAGALFQAALDFPVGMDFAGTGSDLLREYEFRGQARRLRDYAAREIDRLLTEVNPKREEAIEEEAYNRGNRESFDQLCSELEEALNLPPLHHGESRFDRILDRIRSRPDVKALRERARRAEIAGAELARNIGSAYSILEESSKRIWHNPECKPGACAQSCIGSALQEASRALKGNPSVHTQEQAAKEGFVRSQNMQMDVCREMLRQADKENRALLRALSQQQSRNDRQTNATRKLHKSIALLKRGMAALLKLPAEPNPEPVLVRAGIYRHYKGQLCRVFGMALHTEDNTWMVRYAHCNREGFVQETTVYVRPLSSWAQRIHPEGPLRFCWVGEVP